MPPLTAEQHAFFDAVKRGEVPKLPSKVKDFSTRRSLSVIAAKQLPWLEMKDEHGLTPIHYANQLPDGNGQRILDHWAQQLGVGTLPELGKVRYKTTPDGKAAEQQLVWLVRLNQKANIERYKGEGHWPEMLFPSIILLRMAARYGCTDVVSYLMDYHKQKDPTLRADGYATEAIATDTKNRDTLDRMALGTNFQWVPEAMRREIWDCVDATELGEAAKRGDEATMRVLLDEKTVQRGRSPSKPVFDINWPASEEETPLMLAAKHGHEGSVRMLLDEAKAQDRLSEVLQTVTKDGKNALMIAAEYGHAGIARMLLEDPSACKFDQEDKERYDALDIAVNNRRADVVSLLLGLEDGRGNKIYDVSQRKDLLLHAVEHPVRGYTNLPQADRDKHGELPPDLNVVKLLLAAGCGDPGMTVTRNDGLRFRRKNGQSLKGKVSLSQLAEADREPAIAQMLRWQQVANAVASDSPEDKAKAVIEAACEPKGFGMFKSYGNPSVKQVYDLLYGGEATQPNEDRIKEVIDRRTAMSIAVDADTGTDAADKATLENLKAYLNEVLFGGALAPVAEAAAADDDNAAVGDVGASSRSPGFGAGREG